MRPSSVTSGVRLTQRTVYLSTTSIRSIPGKERLATAGTSIGNSLPDAAGVHLADADGGAAVRPARAEHAVVAEGEGDVLGGQLVAVVEFHALAELQLDHAVADAPRLGRQHRDGLQLAGIVAAEQPFPERGDQHPLADVGLLAQRLQRIGVADLLHRDGDGRALVGLADGEARQGGDARGGGQQATAVGSWLCSSVLRSRSSSPSGVARKAVSVRSAWRIRQDRARWA